SRAPTSWVGRHRRGAQFPWGAQPVHRVPAVASEALQCEARLGGLVPAPCGHETRAGRPLATCLFPGSSGCSPGKLNGGCGCKERAATSGFGARAPKAPAELQSRRTGGAHKLPGAAPPVPLALHMMDVGMESGLSHL
uniref:Uncharacterized protein n=1 Tax=Varanus komodoensis TaxID=61221 RepID=A0A8D2Q4F1_VARKO